MLLALLTAIPPDTLCATPQLCRMVEAAAEANREPGRLARYTARVESEVAVINVRPGQIDGPTTVEAYESSVTWVRDSAFRQHAIGYRARSTSLPLSMVRYLILGWIAPITYGDRLAVFGRHTGRDSIGPGRTTLDPALVYAIHPLASDRLQFYRYTAADTVLADRFRGDTLQVIRVGVEPTQVPSERRLLFRGSIDLEPHTLQVVRLRGRLHASGEPFQMFQGLAFVNVPRESYLDLENALDSSGTWLPAVQRFEWQGKPAPGGGSAALRVVSTFRNVSSTVLPPGAPDAFDDEPAFLLSAAPGDSLRHYDDWLHPLGWETARFDVTDFTDLQRGIPISKGTLYLPAPRGTESLVRYNRIEGIYLGLPVTYEFGGKLTGLHAHANAGYAFWEEVVRWNAGLAYGTQAGGVMVSAGRRLEVTNKFRSQFDNPALGAFLSRDNWDYVDRTGVGITARIPLRHRRGTQINLSAEYMEDGAVERILTTAPYVGYLRPNRGIYEGQYLRTMATIDINPDISPVYVRNGVGFQLIYDAGYGDLGYQRFEGRIVARYDFRRVFLIIRAHAGAVFGDSVPPQQLFEIGGAAGLPGYEYKQFAGDRAALTRIRLSLPLPFLQAPIFVARGIAVPPLTPSISLGVQGAVTDISNSRVAAAVNTLGYAFDTHTGETAVDPVTGAPLPASVETGGLRSSVDVRAGFFNDALSVGVAHALGPGPNIGFSFFLAFGRQF